MEDNVHSLLVIRLGAMGDILHALPAVSSLKSRYPESHLIWLVARKWLPLLAGNPDVDELIPFERRGFQSLRDLNRSLQALGPDIAIDFQGLLQSAIAGRMSRPRKFLGFDRSVAREPFASLLYSHQIAVTGPHRIERNFQLAQAAGAETCRTEVWLPAGTQEANTPDSAFVLASPFAGWRSKQWPLENFDRLGAELQREGLQLVLNVPPERAEECQEFEHVTVQSTSLSGLIYSTRQATAMVGVDSGPLHLAAALGKPGVALFGPTDPKQTGPYGSSMCVLRGRRAATTYKRGNAIDSSMMALAVSEVMAALKQTLAAITELDPVAGRAR